MLGKFAEAECQFRNAAEFPIFELVKLRGFVLLAAHVFSMAELALTRKQFKALIPAWRGSELTA
jgi:hypothetical protein